MQTNPTTLSNRSRRIALSRHAQTRVQQRSISADAVQVITSFGERTHDGRGGIRCLMTDKAMARVVRTFGRTQQVDSLAGAYAVLSAADESVVITVGHRYD